MKYLILLLVPLFVLSCVKDDGDNYPDYLHGNVCGSNHEIFPPGGFEMNEVGSIEFEGSTRYFQFITENIGYAMGRKTFGGNLEFFKTEDGGHTWENIYSGPHYNLRNMNFRDENFGIITVHDVTGCPPPNCLHKCVLLKTENGGEDWEEIEVEDLQGILIYPKFDADGNIYAKLFFNQEMEIHLMRSRDNGISWDTLVPDDQLAAPLTKFDFKIFNNRIYTTDENGRIVVFDMDGRLVKTVETSVTRINELYIIDENTLFLMSSNGLFNSFDGGLSWEESSEKKGAILGFEGGQTGIILEKSACIRSGDLVYSTSLILSTFDGGLSWEDAEETTTNRSGFYYTNSQKMDGKTWRIMFGNQLFELIPN